MIFESHAHYDDSQYDDDRDLLLSELSKQNVGCIINVGADLTSSAAGIKLAEKYPYVYCAVGVHPDETEDLVEDAITTLREMASAEKVVAIGEIGLDYYRKEGDAYKEVQKKWFLRQLELAAEMKKPVIVHSRDAAEDTLQVLKDFGERHKEIEYPGVIHCYSYSPEMAELFVSMGYYIGIGGVVTFKNAKKLAETAERIPLERILVETDSPYLSPEPYRGKRNHSGNIKYVIEKIAQIRGITPEEVERQTEINARNMYGL